MERTLKRIFARIRKDRGCWVWTGAINDKGYGRTSLRGKQVYVHRAVWILTRGAIPRGLCVLHKCDTPRCVNPKHLWLGTKAANSHDMVRKDRQHKQLTWAQAHEIRVLARKGLSRRAIANRYGVSHVAIQKVVSRKTWRHVP